MYIIRKIIILCTVIWSTAAHPEPLIQKDECEQILSVHLVSCEILQYHRCENGELNTFLYNSKGLTDAYKYDKSHNTLASYHSYNDANYLINKRKSVLIAVNQFNRRQYVKEYMLHRVHDAIGYQYTYYNQTFSDDVIEIDSKKLWSNYSWAEYKRIDENNGADVSKYVITNYYYPDYDVYLSGSGTEFKKYKKPSPFIHDAYKIIEKGEQGFASTTPTDTCD